MHNLPFHSYAERQFGELQEILRSVLPTRTHDSKLKLLPGGHAARLASPVDVPRFEIRFG
jgi:hypothetical protein